MTNGFAKFDPRSIVIETLRDLNLTVLAFADLQINSVVPHWTIERALRGRRNFTPDEATRLLELCRELRVLQQESMLPIRFDDPHIREILRARQERREIRREPSTLEHIFAAYSATRIRDLTEAK